MQVYFHEPCHLLGHYIPPLGRTRQSSNVSWWYKIDHDGIKCQNLNFQRGIGLICNFFILEIMMHQYTHNWFHNEFHNRKHLGSLPWWPMRAISEARTNYPLKEQQLSQWSINVSSPLVWENIHAAQKQGQGHYGRCGSCGKPTVPHLSFLMTNEPLFTIQLFLPNLRIRHTCQLHAYLVARFISMGEVLFTLFLCILKGKNFSETQYITKHIGICTEYQEEKSLDLDLLLVCCIFED